MDKITNKNIVALVGMSGAGKSTVCHRFADYGYTVIDCDIVAREVAEPGSSFLKEVAEYFSCDVINADGTLNRKKTAEIIFNDDKKRVLYNSLIYPYITYNVIDMIKSSDGDVLLDAPTLFEAGIDIICDCIVSVCADIDICVERIIARDGIDRALAEARLSSQHGFDFYRERSDHCIINNGTQHDLFAAADAVIRSLKGA